MKLVVAAVLFAVVPVAAEAADLIPNGNFEAGKAGFNFSGDVAVASGEDYVTNAQGSGSPAARQNHFVTFGSGNVGGLGLVNLRNRFNTVAGRTYILSFDYGAFNPTTEFLSYSLTDFASVKLPTPPGTSNLDNLFIHYTRTFTGSGSPTGLGFEAQSESNDNADLFLDNVSVISVPEPASWAMMIGGFGLVGGAMRRRAKVRTNVSFA